MKPCGKGCVKREYEHEYYSEIEHFCYLWEVFRLVKPVIVDEKTGGKGWFCFTDESRYFSGDPGFTPPATPSLTRGREDAILVYYTLKEGLFYLSHESENPRVENMH